MIILFIIILCLPGNAYSADTVLSHDGKWLAIKPVIDNNSITMGIDSIDLKLHSFKVITIYNHSLSNNSHILENEYSSKFASSLRIKVQYRENDSKFLNNFSTYKYIFCVDKTPILVYEYALNGSGSIQYALHRWLY